MSNYLDDTLRPHLRLYLLQSLSRSAGTTAHEYLLRELADVAGYRVAQDLVHAELEVLRDLALVSLERIESAYVATLKQRGADIADGRAHMDAIARPRPGA